MRRRALLQLGLCGLGGLVGSALVRSAQGLAPLPPTKRFLFVVNRGGWDPLNALAPLFGRSQIQMPTGAEPGGDAALPLALSPLRPSVTRFFSEWGARSLVLHGLSVRSVSHDVCELTMLTGRASGDPVDHATRLAVDGQSSALPHLVLAGPSYPGALGRLVARSGASGQLQELIDGTLRARSDLPTPGLSDPAARRVNEFLSRRARAAADAGASPSRAALVESLARAEALLALRYDVSFTSDGSLQSQLDIALEVFRRGLARCITVSPPVSWDTHTDADNQQSPLWESLFAALGAFMTRAQTVSAPPGSRGGAMLLDDTVIVVLSEMARTPQLNADQGRDHWPYTSALLVGKGITGGRAVGGYDSGYAGLGVDPLSGEQDPARPAPTPAQLGATLLALASMDPSVLGPGVEPLRGVLA